MSVAVTEAAPARAAAMATMPEPDARSSTRAPATRSGWSSTWRASAWPPAQANAQYGMVSPARSHSANGSSARRSVISGTRGVRPGSVFARTKSGIFLDEVHFRWRATETPGEVRQVDNTDRQPAQAEPDRVDVQTGQQPDVDGRADQRHDDIDQHIFRSAQCPSSDGPGEYAQVDERERGAGAEIDERHRCRRIELDRDHADDADQPDIDHRRTQARVQVA